MVDTILLKEIIKESGYKSKFIAKSLGVSYQSLLNKLNNLTNFKPLEIQKLCKLLKLSPKRRDEIFFACCVGESDNSVG